MVKGLRLIVTPFRKSCTTQDLRFYRKISSVVEKGNFCVQEHVEVQPLRERLRTVPQHTTLLQKPGLHHLHHARAAVHPVDSLVVVVDDELGDGDFDAGVSKTLSFGHTMMLGQY